MRKEERTKRAVTVTRNPRAASGCALRPFSGERRCVLRKRTSAGLAQSAIRLSLTAGRERGDDLCRSQLGCQAGRGVLCPVGCFPLGGANAVYGLAEQSTGMVRGRLLQDAFYVLFFALAGILMAVILNWRNDKQGYWMNGTLIAFADIPFVLFVLVPGLIPWWPGLAGPLLWLIAFLLTSIARVSADSKVVAGAHA